uniref:Dermokine n=1 Tax=Suricata suricatta TaxID=37032 RepID=A0A673VHM3_SURSU
VLQVTSLHDWLAKWEEMEGYNSGSSSSSSGGGSSGGNKPECDSSGNGVRMSGGSGGQNSQTSPGLFNFETFWKNFKSKLGFINWDAINKDFKHNTPFLNWRAIIEGADASSLQKRSGGAGQSDAGWEEVAAVTSKNNYKQKAYPTPSGGQYSAKIPSKGGATPSSSASRVQPGLLQWVKVW